MRATTRARRGCVGPPAGGAVGGGEGALRERTWDFGVDKFICILTLPSVICVSSGTLLDLSNFWFLYFRVYLTVTQGQKDTFEAISG